MLRDKISLSSSSPMQCDTQIAAPGRSSLTSNCCSPTPHTPCEYICCIIVVRACKMLNAWIDHHERSERCTVLTSMTHFDFRKLHPTNTMH